MKDKYIIINRTTLEKRIEKLEEEYKSEPAYQFNNYGDKLVKEIMILKQILSQSTPLIPEIEKAFDAAKIPYKYNNNMGLNGFENSEHYISNLKIEI